MTEKDSHKTLLWESFDMMFFLKIYLFVKVIYPVAPSGHVGVRCGRRFEGLLPYE